MSEIKRLLNSLLWEIYGRIPSSIARKHNRSRHLKMHNRLYEPRLLEKLGINVLNDICAILKLEIRLISRYLQRVLISRDKNRTQQTILYGFLDVIVSSRLGESSREMRFNLSPPTGGGVKGRGDGGRPIITDETNSSSDFNQWLHAMKMVARLPGGMPPEFRRKLWLALAEKYLKSKNVDWEKEEIKCFSEQWREDDEELGIQIVKDLHRTGSSLCSGPAGTINQAKLKRILLGYARYNPEVGYCQGFNMLGALILQVMDKEEIESIKVMIYLVEGILPRGYFSGSLGGLQADMAVFRELMTCKLPRLAKHLQKLQGPVENAFEPPLTNVFTMQWFLTMFCTCLPMTCVLRVWDLVLIEGSDVLLRTALVLWSLLEERILNARTADDFYCKMGSFSSELLNGHLIDSNGLIEKVVDLGPIPELQKLRDKHLYNISPFRDKTGLQLYYSDEEGDSDEDSRMAVATAWGLRLSRRGSAGLSNKTDGKDRIALDISLLKKQYDRLRERQRQAHIILTSAVARQGSNPNQSTIQMNQLLIGRNAIVTNNGRRLGPPQGAIPPARKPSLPTAKSPKLAQTKTLRRGETLHWRDTELSKRRRGSLKWKDIKSDSSQSGQDDRPAQLNESAPSSRSSSSEPKSQRGSLKTRQRSDSSSYSEDSDGNSSTSTSLCDEDDHETGNLSSLEGSPMKKSKKKHSEVPHKKCLEDVLNSNEKPHSVDSQIPFIQLTTMDSPVLNANKTDIDSLEYSKEDSETESNRLDYAGFVDEYSWPDMNEATSSRPLEDVTIDVSSNEGDFLSLSNVITSTSQLSPIPDITTYINNSNISPLRTPVSAFDYANLVVSMDDSKKFDVNDEGVTNEYFERINVVERPTKLDLLYSLNEEDSIRNAYKMPSCPSSPELAVHEEDASNEKPSPESSKFLIYEQNNKQIPPSTEEMDRKMKVLLEYSNQSSLSFIAEAKHEISSGLFKEKEFDPISLKYQLSALVPSNRASADIKPTTDETIEHIFIIPTVERKVTVESVATPNTGELESPAKTGQVLKTEENLEKAYGQETSAHLDDTALISTSIPVKGSFTREELGFEKKKQSGQDSFNTDQFIEDAECQIPSTEDLEMRFKALEKSFTDRKGPSSRAKSIENENKPVAKTLKELDENEPANPETTTLEPSSIITDQAQKLSVLNAIPASPLKEETHEIENPNSIIMLEEVDKCSGVLIHSQYQHTSIVDEPICDENQTESHCLTSFSKERSIKEDLVPDQTHDIDKQQYSLSQDKSTTLSAKHESDADCDTSIKDDRFETSNLDKSSIPSAKNVSEVVPNCLIKMHSQSESHNQSFNGLGLEMSVFEQSSDIKQLGIMSFKDVSDVENDDLNKAYSQSAYQNLPFNDDVIETSVIDQTSCTENTKFPSSKDEAQVDENFFVKEHLKEEIVVRENPSDSMVDNNLPAQPLSYSQDHFGDKVISKPTFESSSASQSTSVFNKPSIGELGFEAKHHLQSTIQNIDKNNHRDKYPADRQKLENFDAEVTHVVSKTTVGKDQLPTEPIALLSYSEDHFGEKHTSQLRLENLVSEELNRQIETPKQDSVAPVAQLPTFLEDHVEKLENLAKQSCMSETPMYQYDATADRIKEKASSKQKLKNSEVSSNAEVTQPQKQKIPSTEDLETRFMALERQLSEKPLPDIVNQSTNKDIILQTKDSVLVLDDILTVKIKDSDPKMIDAPPTSVEVDVQVKVMTTEEQKIATAKPIPSTADLEHRFRALERKLSSTNMNSSKATASQEDDLKALRQSNIVTNPSIVLPNNEETTSSNTPSSTKTSSKSHEDQITNNEPPFIRKRIPSTEDLESRFQALEIQKSLKSPASLTANLLSPSKKTETEFVILEPEMDANLKRKSDIPSTQDLENRFQALEQSKLVQKPLKEDQNENKPDSSIPSTKDLETRFQALEKRKSIVDSCTKTKECDSQVNCDSKTEQESKTVPSTLDLEMRFQALEQKKSMTSSCTKSISDQSSSSDSKTTADKPNKKDEHDTKVPSTEDLETRYEALEQRKSISDINTTNSSDSKTSGDLMENKTQVDKVLPSTEDLESRFEALEKRKSVNKSKENQPNSGVKTSNNNFERMEDNKKLTSTTNSEPKFENEISVTDDCPKTNISRDKGNGEPLDSMMPKSKKEQKDKKLPSTQDLESRFEALEQKKSTTDISKGKDSHFDFQSQFSNKTSEETEKLKMEVVSPSFSTKHEVKKEANVPSTQDLETRFEALEKQKPKDSKDSKLQLAKIDNTDHKKLSKVPSTHDLEKRFDKMQIDTKKLEQTDFKVEQKQQLLPRKDDSAEPFDQHKRKDLYKLESQSDETLTATDQTSTEFETKTESRPTSCPEYSDPFDSNIVTTDRVLKIIEENSKILHRILKKTLADAGDNTENNTQSKKSSPGITDSLLALGNIFPRSDETISPSRIKSHSWIRPSVTLRSDDNISDRLASIKSTIKSIDTLCEEKSFRKEKCQRYIDSLFARPTITTTTPTNPSIKVDDFECKPSQDRVPKRELKKDISPRRRRDEEREEYESRVRRDMMPNSLDTSSDLSFSLANIEQVDSEVDRINEGNQVDTQMERPLSPYYVSGYDLNKRSITPVVYIPTKLEIRHTTVTSTFYDRYLTEKHIERTFPRTKKSPVSPTITKSYLDISNYSLNSNDRSSKSAENSPSRRKDSGGLSPNETVSLATNNRNLVSTLDVTKKDLHIRSCDNILLQLRSSTNKEIVPSIMVYNPLPAKIRKPPELGISLGLYKDYGSDESSKS